MFDIFVIQTLNIHLQNILLHQNALEIFEVNSNRQVSQQ